MNDDEEDAWFQAVATMWAREYDPREDIYTPHDGDPIDNDADEGPQSHEQTGERQ
jgi:hypothetical protein